ncbi:hypothetical protein ACBQ54_14485 [Providencia vermicola]|uniref:tail fiber/spike domain-containing protein n=1 Tax=Providencia vermicola TaxID=333965 RepID=UPI003523A10C
MTKYDTNNPIGSPSVKDVNDNSINFDHATNDRSSETWQDRLGAKRKTWHGLEKDNERSIIEFKQESDKAIIASGYAPVGTFQEGAKLEALNEIVLWRAPDGDGENYKWTGPFPKTVPADSTPASTGGIKTESNPTGLWVGVGDASLRQDLNKGTGANLVRTHSGQTVEESLRSINQNYVNNTIPPSLPTVNNSSTKLLIKNTKGDSFSDYYVVTRKADGVKGYIAMGITNTAVKPDASNFGGNSPIRPSEALNLSEVYVGYFQLHEKSATVTQTNFDRSTLQKLTGITGVMSGKLSLVNKLGDSETSFVNPQCLQLKVNDSVVYKITKKAESIRFGMSNGSSDNVIISVSNDGLNYKDINIISLKAEVSKTGYCDIDLNISTATTSYIKIRNGSQVATDVAYVFGVNVRKLEHCSVETQFDSYIIASTAELDSVENKYQHGNGANEFAAHQKNGKWFGTYHGGHSDFLQRLTLSSRRYNVNTSYDELLVAELTDVVRLHSISNLAADSTTYKYIASTTWGDGVHVTDYSLELKDGAPVLCDNAYTNMCTTSIKFNWVHHPVLLENVTGYKDIEIGQAGFVEQFFAGSERTIKNYFTQVPVANNNKNGVFIRFNATYNKVYCPIVLSDGTELYGGNFTCCKSYS